VKFAAIEGLGLSSGSPRGIREELANQQDRTREAISTWPLAPRSGSLSGYREIHDVSWRTPRESGPRRTSCIAPLSGAQLPALEHGVFATVLVTSAYISLAFLFALLSLRLIRRGRDAALIDFSWWRLLFGPGGVATAQQAV
jgi:hypothetical protein